MGAEQAYENREQDLDHVQRVLAIVLTGGLLLLTLELVRRKRLMERYALLWLFATAVLIVLG